MPQLDLALAPQNDAYRATILSLPAQIRLTSSHAMSAMLPARYGGTLPCRKPYVPRASSGLATRTSSTPSTTHRYPLTFRPTRISCSRVKITGITETTFKVGELLYKLFDVGGQRSEQKKWIHCFTNVMALAFLVSLSECDRMLYEGESAVCFIPFLISLYFPCTPKISPPPSF